MNRPSPKRIGQFDPYREDVDEFTRVIEGKKSLPPEFFQRFRPRLPKPLTEEQWIQREMLENSRMLSSTFVLDRGLTGISTSVTNTAIRVIQARSLKGYILANPTVSTGKATSGTLVASGARAAGASGNTQSASLDVSDYTQIRLFLDISANASANVVAIGVQSQDPVSGNWANAQLDVFSSPTAVGTYYASIGSLGVDENLATSWSVSSVGGTTTFSLGYILKDASGAFSLSNVVYLGGPGVTTSSGYPLIEGHELRFYLKPNVELWAVSSVAAGLALKIFEMQ